ncbi:PEP-utilizing enzyme [Nonomuraea thailandensis]
MLVATDLSPADTAGLGPDVVALVTEHGGPTSHTAILARARACPPSWPARASPASPTAR